MSTHAQTNANRANAQFSTGPNTSEGKQRVSLNALKWGLTRRAGFKEEEYVRTIVDCKWRLNRLRASEDSTFALGRDANYEGMHNPTADRAVADTATLRQAANVLDSLSRHEARLSREFSKTMKALEETQTMRKTQEKAALEQAVTLYKLQKMLDQQFNPREFGFELSIQEIERHARLTERLQQAETARKYSYNKPKYLIAVAA